MAETIIVPVQDQMTAELGPITADLGLIVSRAARQFGSKTALVAGGRTLTYQALDDLCDRVAADLPKTSTGKVMRRELKTLDG